VKEINFFSNYKLISNPNFNARNINSSIELNIEDGMYQTNPIFSENNLINTVYVLENEPHPNYFFEKFSRIGGEHRITYFIFSEIFIEKLSGVTLKDEIRYFRILLLEFERVISHLSLFTYVFFHWNLDKSVRSKIIKIQDIKNKLNFLFFNYKSLRNPKFKIEKNDLIEISLLVQELEKIANVIEEQVFKMSPFIKIFEGGSFISKENAVNFNLTGPILRASNVNWDLRKNDDYLGYRNFNFETVVAKEGDSASRFLVRLYECFQSINICQQALKKIEYICALNLRKGKEHQESLFDKCEIQSKEVLEKLKYSDSFLSLEGPEGEIFIYLSNYGQCGFLNFTTAEVFKKNFIKTINYEYNLKELTSLIISLNINKNPEKLKWKF